MARFHGQVSGSRQPATRVGTQDSGIRAALTSGSRDVVETGVGVMISGATPGEETVRLGVTYLNHLVLDVEIDAAAVAGAMNYDPYVRRHLGAIYHHFTKLNEAAAREKHRRTALALRASQGRS